MFGLVIKDRVILLMGDIYLRGKSFDFALQEEHVGCLCVAHCWTHFQTRSQMLDLGGHTHSDCCTMASACLLTKCWFCLLS